MRAAVSNAGRKKLAPDRRLPGAGLEADRVLGRRSPLTVDDHVAGQDPGVADRPGGERDVPSRAGGSSLSLASLRISRPSPLRHQRPSALVSRCFRRLPGAGNDQSAVGVSHSMCRAGKPSAGLTLDEAVRYNAGYLRAVSCKWTSQWPSGTVQGRSWSGVAMTAPGGMGPVRPTLMRPEAPVRRSRTDGHPERYGRSVRRF
jgi:hypothetical protein